MGGEVVTVPEDICRCHDNGCPERNLCLRWMQRETGGPRTPHSHSLYQGDSGWEPERSGPRNEPCLDRIPA